MREKGLQRLATKGVVRLFNAIAKAQKQLREAEEATGSRAKAVKLGKASFLAQLKSGGAAAGARPGEALVPSAPARQAAAGAAEPVGGSGKQQQQRRQQAAAADSSDEDEDARGWDVLKQGFVGLQGAQKCGPQPLSFARMAGDRCECGPAAAQRCASRCVGQHCRPAASANLPYAHLAPAHLQVCMGLCRFATR